MWRNARRSIVDTEKPLIYPLVMLFPTSAIWTIDDGFLTSESRFHLAVPPLIRSNTIIQSVAVSAGGRLRSIDSRATVNRLPFLPGIVIGPIVRIIFMRRFDYHHTERTSVIIPVHRWRFWGIVTALNIGNAAGNHIIVITLGIHERRDSPLFQMIQTGNFICTRPCFIQCRQEHWG